MLNNEEASINDNEQNKGKDEEDNETNLEDLNDINSNTVVEPEDNDGENRFIKEEDKLTMKGAVVTLMKCMIGCGILTLPACFKTLGIIGGLASVFVSMCITISSIYFLMKCKHITQRYGYSMYAKICFGFPGTVMMKSSVIAMSFGISCVYLKVFGGIFQTLVELFITPNDSFFFKPTFYILLVFFLLMPLMFKENITGLKKFSFLGIVSIYIFLISMIIVFIYKYLNNEIKPFDSGMLYPKGTFIQLFIAASSILDAFTFQMNTFPIYLALKKRKSKYMVQSIAISAFLTALLYAMTGVLGFLIYRERLDTVVIEYLTLDIHKYKHNNLYISALLFICTLSFYLSALFSAPLMFFGLRKYLLTLLGLIKRKMSQQTNTDDQTKLMMSTGQTKVIMEAVDEKTRFIIAFITYVVVLLCTLSVDNLLTITGIVGSTVSNVISMLAPTMFIFYLSNKPFCSFEKMLSKIVFAFGLSVLLMFFYTQIIVFF